MQAGRPRDEPSVPAAVESGPEDADASADEGVGAGQVTMREHHLVQAPVTPLDEDGVSVTIAGTVLFALATVVLWVLRSRLADAGHGWWPWVGVAGTVLGVVAIAHTTRRRGRRTVSRTGLRSP